MSADEFTCADCGQTFTKGWSDEEAAAESLRIFGDTPLDNLVTLCDDCFKRLRAMFQ